MAYDYLSCSSYLHINIFVIIGVNYPVEGKEGGILNGGVLPCSPNPDLILDQKIVIFPHPFSDLASKTHTRFQTWPLRNYLDKNSNKKDFLKAFLNSHTSLSFLLIWNWNDKYVHTVL